MSLDKDGQPAKQRATRGSSSAMNEMLVQLQAASEKGWEGK
ncbi:hypothetical protein KC19_10G160900 [Ceratodon purpureus]|uniref:Uncharacterized protein n=1 Tax=Ceratodon purpureus TaxID=3225 RepID=A0A8T0GKY4_CERPU|nr:hypothetical protein KC19_10G160900 [Ceratodon purpureus]